MYVDVQNKGAQRLFGNQTESMKSRKCGRVRRSRQEMNRYIEYLQNKGAVQDSSEGEYQIALLSAGRETEHCASV